MGNLISTRHTLCICIGIITLLLFSNLYSQEKPLSFEYLTVKDGLAQNTVFSIVKDKYGYMWFGTWNGLCRYDGYRFKVYRAEQNNPKALTSSRIHLIYKDKESTLWISTFDSLICRYNYDTDDFTRFSNRNLPRHIVDSTNRRKNHSNLKAKSGDFEWNVIRNELWQTNLSTQSKFKFNSDVYNPNSLNDKDVSCIYKDNEDILWVGTSKGGINKVDLKRKKLTNYFNTVPINNTTLNASVRAVMTEGDNIWVGNNTTGLSVINRKTGLKHYFPVSTATATNSSELSVISSKTGNRLGFPVSTEASSTINSHVRVIYKDHKGDIWIGYRTGLDRYIPHKNTFIHYANNPTGDVIPNHTYYDITEDKDHVLWLTSRSNLYRYDRATDKFTSYSSKGITIGSGIMCIKVDSDNNFWLGTEGNGVFYIKRDKSGIGTDTANYLYSQKTPNSIPGNRIYSIAEDEFKNIWIGTSDGLCKIDPVKKTLKRFAAESGLADLYISKILPDLKGNVWVSHKKGISKVNIKGETVKNHSIREGYEGYEFMDCSGYRDSRTGEMFFGGMEGFVSFFPEEIVDNPYPPKVVFTDLQVLNKPVGINQEVNGSTILEKPLSLTKKIVLTHLDKSFSVEFAALHYSNPQKNKYAYKLEGFDNEWIYTDASKRTATYVNLNPGKYILKVKASNCDDVWVEEPATLEIVVLPPWWKTWWSNSLVLFIIIGIVYGYIYLKTSFYRKKQKELTILVEERTRELEKSNNQLIENQSLIQTQNDQLKALNKTKDRFFSIIAHDLRNPFHAVKVFADNLLNNYKRLHYERIEEYISSILTSSMRGYDLLENLLNWSRSQTASIAFSPENVNINSLIKQTFEFLEASAQRKNIEMRMSVITNTFVFADKNMLTTVLRNLLSNAIKYTKEGGQVSIRVDVLESEVEISVKDNGVGIPEDIRKVLFSIDKNVSTKGTEDEGGTGLGLILCKEFIEKHGGKIEVESKEGEGTCFKVFIPRNKENSNRPEDGEIETVVLANKKDKDIAPKNSKKIVEERITVDTSIIKNYNTDRESNLPLIHIIEDDDAIRSMLIEELGGHYIIADSPDGIEGFKKACEQIPDLIVSDISMPLMDGIELCGKLKTDQRTCHIPVILLTALQSEENIVEGFETGADAYITKPFNLNILRIRIKNLIASRRKLRELFSQNHGFDTKIIATNQIDKTFLNNIVTIINDNIEDRNLNVELLADKLSLSRSQLYRKIKALTNQSAYDFITTIRLKKAADLLATTDLLVADISFMVGYPEASNFSRVFVKQYGKSPKDYAAEFKGKGKVYTLYGNVKF